MKPPVFHDVAVVGMHFREKDGIPAKSYVASFVPPVGLILEREPTNPYDSFAIKVLYKGHHIGYIEASNAMYIAPWMDEGTFFTCTVVDLQQRKNNLHPICTIAPIESLETKVEDAASAD